MTTFPHPHSHPAVQAPAMHPGLLAFILVAGHAIKHMYNQGFNLILPEIARALDLNNTAIGTLGAARSLSGSLSNLPAGFISDRYSHRWGRILGVLMLVIGASQFLMGTFDSYWPILILSVVVSIAISFWHPPAIAALSQRFATRKGFALSLHGMGGNIGEAAGPLIVGGALYIMTWQSVLHISIVPAIITGLVVWYMMRSAHSETAGGTASFGSYVGSLKQFVTDSRLTFLFVSVGGFSTAQAAVNTFLPLYFRLDLGYDPWQTAGFVALGQVAGVASSPVLGYLSDRFGRVTVLVPSLMALALGIFGIGIFPDGPLLLLAVAWVGAFMFPMMALYLATAMDVVGVNVQATTVSLVFGIGTLFGSLSPLVSGALADAYGRNSAFYWGASVAVVAAVVLVMGGVWAKRKAA
ncbi:MAG: MFS transporter [Dehalococcoidia bacterium]|nr:MFS transporter [Dehalococcoidia bacterium]